MSTRARRAPGRSGPGCGSRRSTKGPPPAAFFILLAMSGSIFAMTRRSKFTWPAGRGLFPPGAAFPPPRKAGPPAPAPPPPRPRGAPAGGFFHLVGNVWIYLYDVAAKQFYVAGGSALSPPGIDFTQPQKVEAAGLVGAKRVTEGFSDVGLRPAFDAPPGFRERYKLLLLVRQQKFLTWEFSHV